MLLHSSKKVKAKQCLYRPGQALRLPGGWGSQISRQSVRECYQPYASAVFILQEILLVLIPVTEWVYPRSKERLEGLCQWKILMTLTGIEPATFRLVAQCIDQLRYRAPVIYPHYNVVEFFLYWVQWNFSIWKTQTHMKGCCLTSKYTILDTRWICLYFTPRSLYSTG